MIRTFKNPLISRRSIVRALTLSTTFVALAACEGQKTTAPEMATAKAPETPSLNKGSGGNRVPTIPIRAYGSVINTHIMSGEGLTGVRKLLPGMYCIELAPASFPDGKVNLVFGFLRDPALSIMRYDGYQDQCPKGVVIAIVGGPGGGHLYDSQGFDIVIL